MPMFHRMDEQELSRLIIAYVNPKLCTEKFTAVNQLRCEWPAYYDLLVDYFTCELIRLNAELFIPPRQRDAELPERAQEELLRAAGEGRRLVFYRPLLLHDFILTSAFIFAETFLPALAVLLLDLLSNGGQDIASVTPLLVEQGTELVARMGDYIRSIMKLPAFEGIEHCLFIKASTLYGTATPFALDCLCTSFSKTCDIPVARRWDCWARPENQRAPHNACEALLPKHADPLTNAAQSLVRKGYFHPENTEEGVRYYIPYHVGSPA